MSETPPIYVVMHEHTAEYVAAFADEDAARTYIERSTDGLFVQIDGLRRVADERTQSRTIAQNFKDA